MNVVTRVVASAGLVLFVSFLGMTPISQAAAAVEGPKTSAIFVKIDGIPGGSIDASHKGEIEALSFNWSAKLKDDSAGAAAEMHDALILKPIDVATPRLMLALASGTTIPEVIVTVRGVVAGGKGQQEYLRYTFTDVRLTAVSHAVVNSAQEQVQFRYGKVRVRYEGADGSAVEEGWDAKAKQPAKAEPTKADK